MKLKNLIIIIFSMIFIFSAGTVQAADVRAGDSIYIAPDEVVSGNLFVTGQTITIDGTISGDLITAAQNINVNGQIDGDIIALAAQSINVNGAVGGNIRAISNSIIINGQVARNVNVIGTNIVLGNQSQVGWDVFLLGSNAETRGTIDGDLTGYLKQVLVTGKSGNVNLKIFKKELGQTLTVSSDAIINGSLIYSSRSEANISGKASISGEIEKKSFRGEESGWFLPWLWRKLFAIFSALLAGILLIFGLKNITPKLLKTIENNPRKTILPGLIVMCILPPIALALALTLIGIPLALIAIAVWLILMYFAKILTAILIGYLLIKKISKKKTFSLLWPLILGVFICWLLFSIPFIGWILSLIVTWLGLGGMWLYASNQSRNI